MKHSFIDRYSDRDSLVHRLDPRTKFISTLAIILVVAVLPMKWPAFIAYMLLITTLVILSRVPLLHILKHSLEIMPFVALIAVFIPFFKEGEVAASFNLGVLQVSVTYSGLQVLWNILARAWLSILGLILLTSTTRMTDLLKGMQQLHMPAVMLTVLSFMYRYLFVLMDEVMRLRQARDSRSFGTGKRLFQLRTIGNMVGVLFIRSYERGERVYSAMLSRGFEGQTRTLESLSLKPADAWFGLGFGLTLLAVSLLNFWY